MRVPHLRDKLTPRFLPLSSHPSLPCLLLSVRPFNLTPSADAANSHLDTKVINHRTTRRRRSIGLKNNYDLAVIHATARWRNDFGSLYRLTRDKLHRRTLLWRLIHRIRLFVYFPEGLPRKCWQKFHRWCFRQRYFINTEFDQRCVFADIKLSRGKTFFFIRYCNFREKIVFPLITFFFFFFRYQNLLLRVREKLDWGQKRVGVNRSSSSISIIVSHRFSPQIVKLN